MKRTPIVATALLLTAFALPAPTTAGPADFVCEAAEIDPFFCNPDPQFTPPIPGPCDRNCEPLPGTWVALDPNSPLVPSIWIVGCTYELPFVQPELPWLSTDGPSCPPGSHRDGDAPVQELVPATGDNVRPDTMPVTIIIGQCVVPVHATAYGFGAGPGTWTVPCAGIA